MICVFEYFTFVGSLRAFVLHFFCAANCKGQDK